MLDMFSLVLYSEVVLVDMLLIIVIRYIGRKNQLGVMVSRLLMQLLVVMQFGVWMVMMVVVVRLNRKGIRVVSCVLIIVSMICVCEVWCGMQWVQLFRKVLKEIGLFMVSRVVLMKVVQKFGWLSCMLLVQVVLKGLVKVNRLSRNSRLVVYMVILLISSMKWKLQMYMVSISMVNRLQVRFRFSLFFFRLIRCWVLLIRVLLEFYIESEKKVMVVSSERKELMMCLCMLKCVLEEIVLLVLLSGLNRFIGVRISVFSVMFSRIVYSLVWKDSLKSIGKLLSMVVVKVLVLLKIMWNRLIGVVLCLWLGICLILKVLMCVIVCWLLLLFMMFFWESQLVDGRYFGIVDKCLWQVS